MKEKFLYFGIVLLVFLLSVGLALAVLSTYITVSGTFTVKPPTTINLSSVADSFIEEENSDDNNGNEQFLYAKSDENDNKRSLLKFGLPSLPAEAIIVSANLYLNYWEHGTNDPVHRNYWIYRITSDWTEDGVTWNKKDSINGWTPGGEYTEINGSSISIPASYGWVRFNITDMVSEWYSGTDNYGVLIKDELEDASGWGYWTKFRSKDYDGLDPYLEVTYVGG